jgi:hypothetical protein
LVGALRYGQHRSVPEIHRELLGRGVGISQRTVTNLLERYEELVALRLSEHTRLQTLLKGQGYVILAIATLCSRIRDMRCYGLCASASRAKCCSLGAC